MTRPRIGEPLPRAEEADIDVENKLRRYSLDVRHDEGKHKARVFRAVLGLTSDDAEWLADQIRMSLPHTAVTRVNRGRHPTYEVRIEVARGDRRALITTGW